MTDIPKWAIERACDLINDQTTSRPYSLKADVRTPSVVAMARYISQHEEPPVDPDLLTAREILAKEYKGEGWVSHADQAAILKGDRDNTFIIRAVVAGIKAGKESK